MQAEVFWLASPMYAWLSPTHVWFAADRPALHPEVRVTCLAAYFGGGAMIVFWVVVRLYYPHHVVLKIG
jgi:hypothetical protein